MGLQIAITGSSSKMGILLIEKLLERDDIDKIKGMDIIPTKIDNEKFEFLEGDVRSRDDLEEFIDPEDIVIHLAFILFQYPKNEKHLKEIMEINIEGSKNVFTVSADNEIKKIIYISSVATYGFHQDRDVISTPLEEDDELKGESVDVFYFQHKVQVEQYLDKFQDENPNIIVSRLRPHILSGPNFIDFVNLKPYKDGLSGKFYSTISQPGETRYEQLVHEKDVVDGILYCIDNEFNGKMNIAGDPVNLSKYLDEKDQYLIQVPIWIAKGFLKFKSLFSNVAKLEYYWIPAMKYPVIVNNSKFKQLIGDPISSKEILDEIYEYVN